jgi:hypothetical protein
LEAALDDAERRADLTRYFADPMQADRVLRPGCRGDHCQNIRLALGRLGFDESLRSQPFTDEFDDAVSNDLKRLQVHFSHTSVDGLCGPGTRALLVNALLDRVAERNRNVPFARMVDPERRGDGSVFVSYARADRAHVERFADLIRQWGYAIWYDAGIAGGERFSATLMERIEKAYLVLAFETVTAMKSEWVRKEVEYAAKRGVRILPIEIESVGTKHPLTKVLHAHHRLGLVPPDMNTPDAKTYRAELKQALTEAHRERTSAEA